MRQPRRRLLRLGLLATTLAVLGCDSEVDERGTLLLSVTSDMKLPADIDEVGLLVLRNGVTTLRQTVRVSGDPGDGKLPGSFSVQAGTDLDARLTFRVFGSRNKKIRVTREVIASIPRNRTSSLRMPLNWLCEGDVDTVKNENGDDVPEDKRCGPGTTCDAGTCVPSEITEDALVANLVPPTAEVCVDAPRCFADGKLAALDLATCSVPLENDGEVNVAIVLDKTASPDADGVCGLDACYVLLDRAEVGGWRVEGSNIVLPGPVCDRVKSGLAVGVAITQAKDGSCVTKTAAIGVCGPWFAPGATNTSTAKSPSGFVPGGSSGGNAGAGGSSAGAGGEGGAGAGAGGAEAGAGGAQAGGAAGDAGAGGVAGDAGAGGAAGDAGAGGVAGGGQGGGNAGQSGAGGGPACPPNGMQDCNETDIDCGGFEVGIVQGRTCNLGLGCVDDADCEVGLACAGVVGDRKCARKVLCGDAGPATDSQKCRAQYPVLGAMSAGETAVCNTTTPFDCQITCGDPSNNGNPVDGCECDGGADSLCSLSKKQGLDTPMVVVLAVRNGAPDVVARLHPTLVDGTNNAYAPLFELLQDDLIDGDLAASADGRLHFFGVLAEGLGASFVSKQPSKSLFDTPLTATPVWSGFTTSAAPDDFLPKTGGRPKITVSPTGGRSVTAVTPMGNIWTATDDPDGGSGSAPPSSGNVRPAVGLRRTEGMYWASVVDEGANDRLVLTLTPPGGGPPQTLIGNLSVRKGSSVALFPRPNGDARILYLDPSGTPWMRVAPWGASQEVVTSGGGGYDDFAVARPSQAGASAVSFVGLRHVQLGDRDELSVAFGAADLPLAAGPSGPTFLADVSNTPPAVVAYLDGSTAVTELFVSERGFVRNVRCRGLAADACATTPQPPPLGMLHPRRLAAVAVPTAAP